MASAKTKTTAKQAETDKAPITFEHRGVEFTVPHPLDMPVGLLECEDEIDAVKLILGLEQWEAYKASGATIRDFQELSQKLSEAQGFDDAGN
ncbi:hypothetical protein [Streptomyces sp. NPDC014733]|uniref:hypothetical protein n=1 Tax=Streptomyces sp. NPDC014733 TaxID=3364885 RepID=UPI0036FE66F3